jgi:hypothetical protein
MFLMIYTGIWLAVTIAVALFGFLLGKLPIVDASPLPWVIHRSYVPPCIHDETDQGSDWPEKTGSSALHWGKTSD